MTTFYQIILTHAGHFSLDHMAIGARVTPKDSFFVTALLDIRVIILCISDRICKNLP